MTKQVSTKNTGLRGVMRSAAFVRGFKEARAGIPMDYDCYQGLGPLTGEKNNGLLD